MLSEDQKKNLVALKETDYVILNATTLHLFLNFHPKLESKKRCFDDLLELLAFTTNLPPFFLPVLCF